MIGAEVVGGTTGATVKSVGASVVGVVTGVPVCISMNSYSKCYYVFRMITMKIVTTATFLYSTIAKNYN